ncbi:uncharacterized protein TRAVEDRAFT_52890 [Trametes versicolor FP-101664 SS1]|uniref:uncharacterized protein n=1 Tax=Trametes versicolor (strain FP-101664) TaxID=717944 RepID=UPI00046212B5|nr:uncharacterized protein TRAVEDRAFT_52890 [Trametes versicolor FP-101664 SS1]EIW53765.1 hypothetical protein TRAVEDRAFT_52890 [Trametes versicolor FP-101664 SS1]
MGRSSEKDKASKKDKRKEKNKQKEALQPQAPPRTIPIPPAPSASLPPIPVVAANIPPPPSDNLLANDQVRVSEERLEAPPHTSGQEPNATVLTGKRARSPDPEADMHTRKREKKLNNILSYMYHDTHADIVSDEIKSYQFGARLASCMVHLFVNVHDALVFGQHYANTSTELSDSDDESDSDLGSDSEGAADKRKAIERQEKREYIFQYHAIPDVMPNLKTDLPLLDADQLVTYTNFVRDDTNSLRKDILLLYCKEGLRLDPSYSEAPSNLVKHRHGWENDYTARLLCPQELLDTYNADPEVFRKRVKAGTIKITPGAYCALLYDQKLAATSSGKGDEHIGLLRSLLLVACVWTGRSNTFLPGVAAGPCAGKQPISRVYNVGFVNLRSIAYVIILAHFSLTSQTLFNVLDDVRKFSYLELYMRILSLFRDAESLWCKETLAWWDMQVYGVAPAVPIRGEEPQEETAADRLKHCQKSERKACWQATSRAHRRGPSHPQGSSSPGPSSG